MRAEIDDTEIEFPAAVEQRLPNDLMLEIYELERCIECGCCVAACGTANVRDDFVGAVTANRLARVNAMQDDVDGAASWLEQEIVCIREGAGHGRTGDPDKISPGNVHPCLHLPFLRVKVQIV